MTAARHDDELFEEIHDLVSACLAGDAVAEEHAHLERLLLADRRACEIYLRCVQDTVLLAELARGADPSAAAPHQDLRHEEQRSTRDLSPFPPGAGRAGDGGEHKADFRFRIADSSGVERVPSDTASRQIPNRQSAIRNADTAPARNGAAPDPSASPPAPVEKPAAADATGNTPPGQADRAMPVSTGDEAVARSRPSVRRRPAFAIFTMRWAATVGVCASVAGLFVVPWYLFRQAPSPAPRRVARLQHSVDARWLRDGAPFSLADGETIFSGHYVLDRGVAHIAFPWGTEVTLEAPADIDLRPDESRRLYQGKLVARVAAGDAGFTVETPTVKVIDLGTEFGMYVERDGESEVHVFKGEVETRQPSDISAASSSSLKLTAGQAVSFDAQHAAGKLVAYNPNRFARAWQSATRVRQTRGAVRFVHPQPASVVEGQTESSDAILLFLEREQVALPSTMAATFTQPGMYTTFAERNVWLPAGLVVDSYLLHFDPAGSQRIRPAVFAEGSVTFDRPIVAVIARGDQLAASDSACAHPGTEYSVADPHSSWGVSISLRGLSGAWTHPRHPRLEPAANDRLKVSPDRKTLTIQCSAGGEADQMRVLVASSDEAELPKWEAPAVSPPRPYHDRPFNVHELIQAEDFDEGGAEVAYYDATPSCLAAFYRLDSSVEFLQFGLPDRPEYCVAQARAGEWVGYTVRIEKAGTYVVQARVASGFGGGTAHFEFGEFHATSPFEIPLTGGAVDFVTVETKPIELSAGQHFMRLVMDSENRMDWTGDFDWFRIEPVKPPQ